MSDLLRELEQQLRTERDLATHQALVTRMLAAYLIDHVEDPRAAVRYFAELAVHHPRLREMWNECAASIETAIAAKKSFRQVLNGASGKDAAA